MKKTYYKHENKYIYFGLALALALAAVFYTGVHFINYYAWAVIPVLIFTLGKSVAIHYKPSTPVLILDGKGITILNEKLNNPNYPYENIISIKINSKLLNGSLKLNNGERIILDSVGVNIDEQQEINAFVKKKLNNV